MGDQVIRSFGTGAMEHRLIGKRNHFCSELASAGTGSNDCSIVNAITAQCCCVFQSMHLYIHMLHVTQSVPPSAE